MAAAEAKVLKAYSRGGITKEKKQRKLKVLGGVGGGWQEKAIKV